MVDILLISDGFFHPPFLARRAAREALETVPGCRIMQVKHLDALVGLDSQRFQAVILYYHHKQAEAEAFSALDRFVKNGGGILAIHSATASFKEQQRYFEILGGRFTGHGPVESFAVRPADDVDAAFQEIRPFMVKDELYLHELQADIRVQFAAPSNGDMLPVVWTREEGKGRVCYVGLGHRAETMQQPQMQDIVRRGLLWVIGQ